MFMNIRYLINFVFFLGLLLGGHPAQLAETQDIHSYLKTKLERLDRKDPPFFKLVTKKNRTIYILGSIHDRHPEMLLSKENFEKLQKICNEGATLFIEHITPYEKLMLELSKVASSEDKKWGVISFLKLNLPEEQKKLSNNLTKSWMKFMQKDFENSEINKSNFKGYKIKDVIKMKPTEGIILFYDYSLDKVIEFTLGFENTLLEWKNWKEIKQLENFELSLGALEKDQEQLSIFLRQGIQTMEDFMEYDGFTKNKELDLLQERILTLYQDAIKEYTFNYEGKEQDKVTIERNKHWVEELNKYLESNNDLNPILIVCGSDHLEGSNNFISLLKNNISEYINRIDNNGNEHILN